MTTNKALRLERQSNSPRLIAVLDLRDDQITYVDPLRGEERLSLEKFQRRYEFTGFHMVIRRN